MGFDRVVTLDENVLLEKVVKRWDLVKRRLQKLVAYGLRSAARKCQILTYFAFITYLNY
jgi:hypothetical protein